MAELVEGWNGPFEVVVIASGPKKTEDGKQWTGGFPPFKDMLMWDVRCKTPLGDKFVQMHFDSQPVSGEVLKDAFIEHKPKKDKPGKFTTTLYTSEQREAKKKSGGSFSSGAKPNYTLEQEAYKDGQLAAITAIQGGLEDSKGVVFKMTIPDIRKVTLAFQADILAAGKKAE